MFGGVREPGEDSGAIFLYAECDRCHARVKVRADKRNDLQRDYQGGGYSLRKEIMDDRCFRIMEANLLFDEHFHIISQDLTNGHFISQQEYEDWAKEKKAGGTAEIGN